MAITICLINQKGGCGKSSTCFHLSGALAALGLRVLLIDADPQGSLSQGFFGSARVEQLAVHETIAAIFDEENFFLDRQSIVVQTPFSNIAIAPTNHHLVKYNTPCPETTGMDQYAIREFITEQKGYDIVLIDCPPNLYRCSWASMVATDYVVVPVPPEDFGTQGLRAVHGAIGNVRRLNPDIRRLGHLITRSDRRLLVHRSYEERLRKIYSEMVLSTVIPELSAFKVSQSCRQPVELHDSSSQAASLTRTLAREILDRIGMERKQQEVA